MTQTDDAQEARRRNKASEFNVIASLNEPGGCEVLFCQNIFAVVGCALDHACELRCGKNASIVRLTFLKWHANVSDRLTRAICEIL